VLLLNIVGVTMVTRNRKGSKSVVKQPEVKPQTFSEEELIEKAQIYPEPARKNDLGELELDLSSDALDGVEARAKFKEREEAALARAKARANGGELDREATRKLWLASPFTSLVNVMGIPHGEYPGMSESSMKEEIHRLWKVKDPTKFEPRFKALVKEIDKIHLDNSVYVLRQSSDATIEEASGLLIDLLVSAQADKMHSTVEIAQVSSWTLPFRYFAMRVKSDYIKSKLYDKHLALSVDEDSPFYKCIVGHSVSIAEIPEHRMVLQEVWDWFADMSRTGDNLPHFMR
jgi:hypothetical protein